MWSHCTTWMTHRRIEPTHTTWKCLALCDRDGHYWELYDRVSVPYIHPSVLTIEMCSNGMRHIRFIEDPTCDQPCQSSVFFLSIVVTQHGREYHIRLRKNEYCVGNSLLSRHHIARYAQYDFWWTWWRFRWNEPYIVSVFDRYMNTCHVTHTQHVILDKKTYHIQEINISPQ
jgi:hypothetical protein